MAHDPEVRPFGYEDLKSEYNMTDEQIAKLDRKAQDILGNGIVMIDGALRDEECTPQEKINRSLVFISITMDLIEKNFNEILSELIPKKELN